MSRRCVVGGCSNTRNIKKSVALHTTLIYGDDRPEAKKQKDRESYGSIFEDEI